MTDFATVAQMEERSQGIITAATHPFLAAELASASRAIRNRCGWHVAPAQSVTTRTRGPVMRPIWLPAMEIASVSAAVIDGETIDPVLVEFDPDTGWTNRIGRSWEITFQAGYDDIPEDLVTLTLQVAARALGSPLGLTSEQAGGVSVRYSTVAPGVAGGITLLPHEVDQLAPYRIGWLP